MDAQRWDRTRTLFERALQVPTGRRAAFLARACADDGEVRRTVEGMLEADRTLCNVLDQLQRELGLYSSGQGEQDGRS